MQKLNVTKAVVYYALVFVGLTIIWNVALRTVIIPKYFFETKATVTAISHESPFTRRGFRQTNYFPTYEYVDDKGEKRTEYSRDGFNQINGIFFSKKVGETFKAYYEKGSKGGIFITQTGDWVTFLLGPMMFGLFPGVPIFALVLYLIHRRKNSVLKKAV